MRYKLVFGLGLAIGYVLGTKAGRERYEQLRQAAQRVADNPKVQQAAGLVGAQASRVASLAQEKVGGKVPFLRRKDVWEGETAGPESGAVAADGTATDRPHPEVSQTT